MNLETKYTLSLDEFDIDALKTLLGSLNGEQFRQAGLTEAQQFAMRGLWHLLPRIEDDE